MRTLIALVLGLAVGFVLALIAARALATIGAHPKATMVVMARHLDALRLANGASDCDDAVAAARLDQVRAMAREIDFAFPGDGPEHAAFRRRSGQFRSLAETAATTSGGCTGLATALAELGQGCQDCHRDFR